MVDGLLVLRADRPRRFLLSLSSSRTYCSVFAPLTFSESLEERMLLDELGPAWFMRKAFFSSRIVSGDAGRCLRETARRGAGSAGVDSALPMVLYDKMEEWIV